MRLEQSFRCLLTGVVTGLLVVAASAEDASADDAIQRSYRVQVSDQELASWMRSRSGAPFLRGQSAVDGLILTRSLADDAIRRGLDHAPRTRIELQRLHGNAAMARWRTRLSEAITVSEADIARELDERPIRPVPRRWRLRNLFLRFGSDEPSIARDRLRDLRRRVLDGASFEALAREHSQSETRWRGGLLGNVRLGTFPPTVDEVIRALKPGDVSDVLESADGVTLLYCERILEPITKTAEDVRRQAAHRLHRRHYDRDLAALRETLRAKADKQRIEGPVGPSIRFTGALLDPESLSAVIGRDADAAWSDVWPPAWHEALDRFVVGRMALLHEAERGLGPDADTRSTLRWEARRILASTLLAEEARPRFVEPTEEDLRRAFEIDAASYRLGSSVDLQVVRLPRSETADAVRILTDLRNGELMFDDAARHHSSDPSAERGGRLDGLAVSRIAPRLGLDVARAVRELATGEISELIWAEDALWIVRLQARHPERAPTYDEARRDVRRRWIRDALDRIRDELVARRLDALDIR